MRSKLSKVHGRGASEESTMKRRSRSPAGKNEEHYPPARADEHAALLAALAPIAH
jgi:hypothetical protein